MSTNMTPNEFLKNLRQTSLVDAMVFFATIFQCTMSAVAVGKGVVGSTLSYLVRGDIRTFVFDQEWSVVEEGVKTIKEASMTMVSHCHNTPVSLMFNGTKFCLRSFENWFQLFKAVIDRKTFEDYLEKFSGNKTDEQDVGTRDCLKKAVGSAIGAEAARHGITNGAGPFFGRWNGPNKKIATLLEVIKAIQNPWFFAFLVAMHHYGFYIVEAVLTVASWGIGHRGEGFNYAGKCMRLAAEVCYKLWRKYGKIPDEKIADIEVKLVDYANWVGHDHDAILAANRKINRLTRLAKHATHYHTKLAFKKAIKRAAKISANTDIFKMMFGDNELTSLVNAAYKKDPVTDTPVPKEHLQACS